MKQDVHIYETYFLYYLFQFYFTLSDKNLNMNFQNFPSIKNQTNFAVFGFLNCNSAQAAHILMQNSILLWRLQFIGTFEIFQKLEMRFLIFLLRILPNLFVCLLLPKTSLSHNFTTIS